MEQDEHLSLRQIEQYRERTLAPGEFIRVARHLAVCDACYQRFHEVASLPEHLSPLTLETEAEERAESFHLNYDEHLAPYVDGTINDIDREIVESHVALCEDCAEQLRELFDVKAELARAGVPEMVAAQSISHARSPLPSSTWRERFFNWRRSAFAWRPAQAIAGLLVIALLIIAALMLWRARHESPVLPDGERASRANANAGSTGTPPLVAQPSPTQVGSPTQANHNAPTPNDKMTPAETGTPPQIVKQPGPVSPQRRAIEPQVVVSVNDGGRTLTLDRQHRLSGFNGLPPAYRQMMTQALLEQRIETPPELVALRDRAGRLRGSADSQDSFALLSPIGTMTRSGQPTLRWQPLAGATSYVVKIYDAALNEVAASPPLKQAEWTLPTPLRPGAVYTWQVTATKDGTTVLAPRAPEPQARFQVLSAVQQEDLQRAERIAGDSHLLRGLVYARSGLLDAAESELQKLSAANPDSAVAQKLLQKLKGKREAQRQR